MIFAEYCKNGDRTSTIPPPFLPTLGYKGNKIKKYKAQEEAQKMEASRKKNKAAHKEE
jgi:hypothetical protein